MCGGSKAKTSQKSTSTYTPTEQASGVYTNILDRATDVADTPYNPAMNRSVAGFNPTQTAAHAATTANAGAWQPQFDQAGNMMTSAGAALTGEDIAGYMNPWQQQVVDAALAKIRDQDAMQNREFTANQVAQNGLGGNGLFVGRAQLQADQGENRNATIANLMAQGFTQAQAAAQADKNRGLAAGQSIANLGAARSQLGYTDAAAATAVGNQQQAQQQLEYDTATGNAQQEALFPMQQAQWLASIGAGIAPLTGGTTTTKGSATQSQGKGIGNIVGAGLSAASMLSDERAKENLTPIGKTFDGQTIWKYNYSGDPRTQIGLIAQDVEQSHPDAVSERPDGLLQVDYDAALPDEGFADGGGVFGGYKTAMPWASINPANPIIPQPMSVQPPAQQQQGDGGLADAMALGKKAGAGLDSLWRNSDGAGGWGASIVDTSSLGGGASSSFLSGLGSLFGFADGGLVATPEEMAALEMVESGGRDIQGPVTRSGERAQGPRQIMPATARDPGFGVKPLAPGADVTEQRRFSDDYFNAMLKRYGGDRDAARIAYNGGPARADAWLKAGRDDSVIPRESADYYKKITKQLTPGQATARNAVNTVASGTDGAGTAPLVQKGVAGTPSDGQRYKSKGDRAAGGLLKSLFGVEFNPLNLTENERRALLVAGLGMMSHGDIGRGGMQGMAYLAGAEEGERDAEREASKLTIQMKKDAEELALRTRAEDRMTARDAADQKWREGETGRKNAELTADQKEYEAAVKQGYKKDFATFQREQKAAGTGAGVNPESVREYEYAKSQGFAGSMQDWLKWKAGNKPLTATDKKAIIEADEYQNIGKDAISNLNEAIKLNMKGYSGPYASTRGYLSSQIGSDAGSTTREIENLVQTQAVAQLKQIFGGQPTEGERQILLDLQGSVSESPKVREGIWKRAIAAAQHRLELAKDQSEGIREGSYFKPGGNRSQLDEPRSVKTQTIRPRATDANGNVVEYDGKAWVPAQ